MRIVSTGATITSEKFLEKKRRARRKKILVGLSAFLLLTIVAVLALRYDKLRIQEIVVSGNEILDTQNITSAVAETLSGYYFYLIPRDSSLLYAKDNMRESLFTLYPRLSSLDIELNGLNTLLVNVRERKPYALYCPDSPLDGGDSCYFLDSSGFIFDQAPNFSRGVYFTYTSTPPLKSRGTTLMPSDEFTSLSQFIEKLKGLSIVPELLHLNNSERILETREGVTIIWSDEDDVELLFSNLLSFLGTQEADFWQKVLELDLRTENKVFYKLR
ncbi:MAG TPA: hypothetical protein VJJ48_00550 [Candidatus Paceibacterota bacterium]